jgi:hypothetical protein
MRGTFVAVDEDIAFAKVRFVAGVKLFLDLVGLVEIGRCLRSLGIG